MICCNSGHFAVDDNTNTAANLVFIVTIITSAVSFCRLTIITRTVVVAFVVVFN